MKKLMIMASAILTGFAAMAANAADLKALVRADLAEPVRPAGVNGQASWNMNATRFIYPPVFEMPELKVPCVYRVRVIGADGKVVKFETQNRFVSLKNCWGQIPCGRTSLIVDLVRQNTYWNVMKREARWFFKAEPYEPGAYPAAPRSYREAAIMCGRYLLGFRFLKYLAENGKPDPSYRLNCYPTKMNHGVIDAMVDFAQLSKDDREAALKIARAAADYLIARSQPAGAPLEYFPPTYEGRDFTAGQYAGQNMLVYPASAGRSFLKLYGETKDAKYLAAAKNIAATYLKLQGEDGTWCLKVWEKDGKDVCPNRLHPDSVILFLNDIYELTKDEKYHAASDRAFAYFENGPLKTWNWEGQFEDAHPTEPYVNITHHPPCSILMAIAQRWPKDARRIAQARELLRFTEDQFIYWQKPKDAVEANLQNLWTDGQWDVWPAVVEQYFYRESVDASASKMIDSYLALYDATGDELCLAKARTLGDSIVRIQEKSGRIRSIWAACGRDIQSDWLNCTAASLQSLVRLASHEAK